MKINRFFDLPCCVCLFLFVFVLPMDAASRVLTDSDCIKCHESIVAKVDVRGQKHKTAVNCLDCHLEHPPAGNNAIPKCRMCHLPEDKPHYALNECIVCHDPHAPLKIELGEVVSVNPVCS